MASFLGGLLTEAVALRKRVDAGELLSDRENEVLQAAGELPASAVEQFDRAMSDNPLSQQAGAEAEHVKGGKCFNCLYHNDCGDAS